MNHKHESEAFSLDIFQAVADFCRDTGIPAVVVDSTGRTIFEGDGSRDSFCHILEEILRDGTCRDSHLKNLRVAMRWNDLSIMPCCQGLIKIGVPLLVGDEMFGGIIAGPFVIKELNGVQRRWIYRSLRDLRREKPSLLKALSQIPALGEERASRAAEKLLNIAGEFSSPKFPRFDPGRQSTGGSRIAREMIRMRRTEGKNDGRSLIKLIDAKERELISKIRLGDRQGAREILNEFLGIILFQNSSRVDIIKAHILELVIIISRAAVEEGAKLEDVLGLKYRYIGELAAISDQEALCLWIVRAMDRIMDSIYTARNIRIPPILSEALNFIGDNYNKPIRLRDVAYRIRVSPFYFGHLIKRVMGCTFTDYITEIRIERAKELLGKTDMGLAEIALEVGYTDQSYFTKVFRKREGITPGAFRKRSRGDIAKRLSKTPIGWQDITKNS
ncbi:MAG: helix-turn-helix domain-containing protein [bacterium]